MTLLRVNLSTRVVSAKMIDIAEKEDKYNQRLTADCCLVTPNWYYPYSDGTLTIRVYNDCSEYDLEISLYDQNSSSFVESANSIDHRIVHVFHD